MLLKGPFPIQGRLYCRASKDEAISFNKRPPLCFIDQHFPFYKNLNLEF